MGLFLSFWLHKRGEGEGSSGRYEGFFSIGCFTGGVDEMVLILDRIGMERRLKLLTWLHTRERVHTHTHTHTHANLCDKIENMLDGTIRYRYTHSLTHSLTCYQ